ncbi:MAG TPA: CueP family metal-binding protein [Actinomycetales bacterium]|nr:CueP family metal-binding protein [Actinomycetales bacterium]
MRRMMTAVLSASVLLIAGCSTPTSPGQTSPGTSSDAGAFLKGHGLSGDAVKLIDQLEKLGGEDRPTAFTASVRPDELLLSDGKDEFSMPLPDDQFYLSIAPYADKTHDCYFHSLTTCQGELTEKDVHVKIVNKETGDVLVDEEQVTNPNGFVGFWLPKDVDGTVSVSHEGRAAQQEFSTRDGDATCMTTLKLA